MLRIVIEHPDGRRYGVTEEAFHEARHPHLEGRTYEEDGFVQAGQLTRAGLRPKVKRGAMRRARPAAPTSRETTEGTAADA